MKPRFAVQHFLVCQDAPWLGVPGPKGLRTLEGVGYYRSVPPNAEMPELDLWVYMRFFLTNNVTGRCRFWIEQVWLDAPNGPRKVRTYPIAHVQFWAQSPTAETAIPLRGLKFPGRGRYEFRLIYKRRTRLYGVKNRVVGRDFIHIG
jgi:hypothetical protein